jgi:hypothetical protein
MGDEIQRMAEQAHVQAGKVFIGVHVGPGAGDNIAGDFRVMV